MAEPIHDIMECSIQTGKKLIYNDYLQEQKQRTNTSLQGSVIEQHSVQDM